MKKNGDERKIGQEEEEESGLSLTTWWKVSLCLSFRRES